VMCIICFR